MCFLAYASPISCTAATEDSTIKNERIEVAVAELDKPLYSPFIERYVLDEIKSLRVEQAENKNELLQQIVDREHSSIDRAVTYATDTITYFFYLIAAASSVLVAVGWTSIRDIKDRVHTVADEEITRLVKEYEGRLKNIEDKVQEKATHIRENREEIELTQEMQSLWLKAQQESLPKQKIPIYDQLLRMRSNDCEALTYKADAVLELDEPQWAVNLCQQALEIDPQNTHAFYQLACAYALMNKDNEAIKYLEKVMASSDSYRESITQDPALGSLRNHSRYQTLINP